MYKSYASLSLDGCASLMHSRQDSENLDLEAILKSVIQKHTRAVLHMLRSQILDGESRHFFSSPQELELVDEGAISSSS